MTQPSCCAIICSPLWICPRQSRKISVPVSGWPTCLSPERGKRHSSRRSSESHSAPSCVPCIRMSGVTRPGPSAPCVECGQRTSAPRRPSHRNWKRKTRPITSTGADRAPSGRLIAPRCMARPEADRSRALSTVVPQSTARECTVREIVAPPHTSPGSLAGSTGHSQASKTRHLGQRDHRVYIASCVAVITWGHYLFPVEYHNHYGVRRGRSTRNGSAGR